MHNNENNVIKLKKKKKFIKIYSFDNKNTNL